MAGCGALACALALPALASAETVGVAVTPSSRIEARGSLSGTVTSLSRWSFTIQTSGRRSGVVDALTAAADNVTKHDYPYVYGGGHAQAGVPSIGIKGPGYNGRRIGYDCSGAVAAVLAGAGLWTGGEGVPSDAGIIAQLLGQRLIARGVGIGPVETTLYDDPGIHIFMNIDGRFFGTSDGGGGANPHGGAGWLDDGAPDASSRAYRPYHVLTSVLHEQTNASHSVTFELGALQSTVGQLQLGKKVRVSYVETSSGIILATGLA